MEEKIIRMAIIGLGQRGAQHEDLLITLPGIQITAVCDIYEDRIKTAQDKANAKQGFMPFGTTDYHEVLNRNDVDLALIATDWEMHVPIAVDTMKAHIITALEVGGAYSVDDCYNLVRTYEETNTPFVILENCCYNYEEVLSTAIARAGKFGKIVDASGSYSHDLRKEVAFGKENRHYRLRNYLNRNTDNYPTHELGPIAKLLDINRGNRMVSLVSMASLSAGMHEYCMSNDKVDPVLRNAEFKQGDIIRTLIKCNNGETIELTLDTTLPRSYTRSFTIRGTKGLYEMRSNTVFLDTDMEISNQINYLTKYMNNAKKYEEEYLVPAWKNITPEEIKAGHGGMDAMMWAEVFKAVRNGEEMPMDVYDAASWMVISALSEQSIQQGGTVQAIPDFTCGRWMGRPRKDVYDFAALAKAKEQTANG